jgi:sugar-specific transcriptional regulator TrmB
VSGDNCKNLNENSNNKTIGGCLETGSSLKPESTDIMMQLGLSQYQARVFLTLEQIGSSTAKEISRKSEVPRQKVYEILESLAILGLIHKELSTPLKFRAESLKNAVDVLLKQKLENYKNLCNKTDRLTRNSTLNSKQVSQTPVKLELRPNGETLIRCIRELIDSSESCIEVVTSWKRFKSKCILFNDELKKAQERSLRIRVVVEKPENNGCIGDTINSIALTNSQFRIIGFTPPANLCLFDERHALIFTETGSGLRDTPALLTNNMSLVELAKAYCEKMWLTSKPFTE